jgi:hypothetical protein
VSSEARRRLDTCPPTATASQARDRTIVMEMLLEQGALAPSSVLVGRSRRGRCGPDVDGMADVTVTNRQAFERSIGSVLRGRPDRPAIRPRS